MAEAQAGTAAPPLTPPIRSEFVIDTLETAQLGEVVQPLSAWERLANITAVRRVAILVVLALMWEAYARSVNNPLMFPSFGETLWSLWDASVRGPLLERIWTSIRVLVMGYAAGVAIAAVFTALAV